MLDYIERKQFTGESSSSLAAQKQAAINKENGPLFADSFLVYSF